MHRMYRSVVAFSALVALAACGGGSGGVSTPADNAQGCQSFADCPGTDVCVASVCTPICHANTDCTSPQVCEEGVCQLPACGSDSQCAAGQQCINGGCTSSATASDVVSCDLTPSPGDVHVGSTLQLTAVAHDASGDAVRFHSFGWAVTSGTSATVDAASGLVTGASSGDTTITATVTGGSTTCSSIIHVYADPSPATSLRVTVIDIQSKEPVAGAKVVIDPIPNGPVSAPLVTSADGTIAPQALAAGPHDVHVFAAGYNYTSFIQTNSTDLLIPLTSYVDVTLRSGFTNHVCDTLFAADPACTTTGDFAKLDETGGQVNLAFYGSGIPNSLLDLSIDTLVGPSHSVTVPILSKAENLPYGLVLGALGQYASATPSTPGDDYRVYTDPGLRAIWGIGGNVQLSDVTSIITQIGGGAATIDIGTLLPEIIPLLGDLQAGAVVGVKSPANGTTSAAPTFDNSKPIELDSKMRLRVDATSPNLPQLDGVYLDGVIALVGAMDFPIGFVPLGFTAGLSAKDGHGGILDPSCDTTGGAAACDTNNLPLKFAPENGGTEGSKLGVALLAVNFGGLTPGSSANIAVSAQVQVADKIDYVPPPGGDPNLSGITCGGVACGIIPSFLSLPTSASITVTKSTRKMQIAGDADSRVQVYRFELENSARLNWYVWMGPVGGAAGTRAVTLPNPTSYNDEGSNALVDPFNDAAPTARLLGMQFTDGSQTADKVENFKNSPRIDELGASLQAFTALQVTVQ